MSNFATPTRRSTRTGLSYTPVPSRSIQRKCACGGTPSFLGKCAECKKSKGLQRQASSAGLTGLHLGRAPLFQARLTVGDSHDPLELEADRIADQVLAAPAHSAVTGAGPRIQRFSGAFAGQASTVPEGVERVLASPGAAMPGSLRQDMEGRFGFDFSQVRMHAGSEAAESARAVNANAYTSGDHVVFGEGRFAPGTQEGRRLIAHELTHVVQQSGGSESTPVAHPVQASRAQARVVQRDEVNSKKFGDIALSPDVAESWGVKAPPQATAAVQGVGNSHTTPPGVTLKKEPRTLEETIEAANADPHKDKKRPRSRWDKILDALNRSTKYGNLGEDLVRILTSGQFIASVVLAVGVYVALWLAPEPVFTKIAAAATTIAILGTGLFTISTIFNLTKAWHDVTTEAGDADADEQIEAAAKKFGKRITAIEADLLVFLASLLVGGRLPGPKKLPPAGAALADAETAFTAAKSGGTVIQGPWGRARAVPLSEPAPVPARGSALALKVEPAPLPAETSPVPVEVPETARPVPANDNAVPLSAAEKGAAGGTKPVTPVIPGIGVRPDPDKDKKKPADSCEALLGLAPNVNARWVRQRLPISGHTTVQGAAFRLDHGIDPPAGQDTTQASRDWVRTIGQPKDDAGHVIANRFGGTADFNGPGGNIFPQNLSFNRGTMRGLDAVAAQRHQQGCDVCVSIALVYGAPTNLRPSGAIYILLYRSPGATGFNPPIAAAVPNPDV